MKNPLDTLREKQWALIPLKIATIYALAAGVWILLSDKLLFLLFRDPDVITRISIVKGWLFTVVTACFLYFLVSRYLKALQRKDDNLFEIVQGISAATGDAFFQSLVRKLAELLNVDYVIVGELVGEEGTLVRTIAAFGRGTLMENFEYDLAGTPCAVVATGDSRICYYPAGAAQQFPKDHLLTSMGVESYIGTPLRDGEGHVLGIMSILNCRPLEVKDEAEAMFRIFAVRAAAELERKKRVDELRAAEARYRILFESNPHPMWVYNLETLAFLAVNDAAVTHYGYSREEFLTMTIKDIRPDEDVPRLLDNIAQVTSGLDEAGIWRHRKKDGTVIDVEITSHTLSFDGRPAEVVLANDVTARQQAEQALRSAAIKYRIVADNTYDWEFWMNPEGRFLFISPSCLRITGYAAEDFQESPDLLHCLIHPDDLPAYHAHREYVKQNKCSGEAEFRIIRRDGSLRWIHHVCQPVFDDTGLFLGTRGSNRDITARKQAEDALQSQFIQISTVYDALNAIVYVASLEDHRILYLNKYAAGLFGSDWQGKPCYEVLQRGQTTPCDFCTNDKLIKDGEPLPPFVWEFQNTKTGRWFQCTDKAIHWIDGRLVRMEIAVDITDRKELERLKDEMVSAVSHEMRTPLTALLGFTEFMLDNDVPPEEQKTYIRTMQRETLRLNEMISNFLDLQRLNSRRPLLNFGSIAIDEVVGEAAALFQAASSKHHLVVDCQADLPQVRGDAEQLYHMLTNLISNAIKYSPYGGTVTVGARQEQENIIIWVRDEGIGISASELEMVFERFYRVDNTDRRSIGGTGIGLALVREIVSAHEGRVWAESTPGKGSTFFVALPVADSELPEGADSTPG